MSALPRRQAPSPLQVTQISTPISETFSHAHPESSAPSQTLGGGVDRPAIADRSDSTQVPRNVPPRSTVSTGYQNPDGSSASGQTRHGNGGNAPSNTYNSSTASSLTTPKGLHLESEMASKAHRSNSNHATESPPDSPTDMPPPKVRSGIARSERRIAPRTSIESTISSVSSTTSSMPYSSQDPMSPNPAELAQMIASAGSAEALIRQLVKEKVQSAAQNAQLWRLVNKQHTLIQGLNADIKRAEQDKERYRRRLRDTSSYSKSQAGQVETLQRSSPAASISPAPSDENYRAMRKESLENTVNTISASSRTIPEPSREDMGGSKKTFVPLSTSASASSQAASSEPNPQPETADSCPESTSIDDSRRNTVIQSSVKAIPPLEIHKKVPLDVNTKLSPRTPPLQDTDNTPSPSSFSARRSLTTPRKAANQSPLIGSTTPTDPIMPSPVIRKGPPAPLNLTKPPSEAPKLVQPQVEYGPDDHSESDYDEINEVDEIPAFERGRKKTREEDDRERELIFKQEQESRSQSKKQKKSKSVSKSKSAIDSEPSGLDKELSPAAPAKSLSPSIRAFAPDNSPSSLQTHLSPHASLAGMLSGPPSSAGSVEEQTATNSLPPLSPGLPISPRPSDRPVNSPPPRQPRDGYLTSPPLSPRGIASPPALSPRPPRHPIPLPPNTPTSLLSPVKNTAEADRASSPGPKSPMLQPAPTTSPKSPKLPKLATSPKSASESNPQEPAAAAETPAQAMTGGIYRGLVSETYPNLLLPPNALPSIIIKVTSSRLKPSRHSVLSMKGLEEDPVFTLGVTARSDMNQLWRVEKSIMSLPQLDQQIKQAGSIDVKLPDRNLFTGHAPAKVDARRTALEKYFEDLLDTPMDEKAALVACQFFSTNVIEAEDQEGMKSTGMIDSQTPVALGSDGRIVKEGFLTKRGKNFGGWKARFFVLDDPVLRYYESPGGSLLGSIRLSSAQIGRQSAHTSQSPSRGEEADNQFRHAFLILEPKRRDSKHLVRHVLCAENDAERDEWVVALLQYVGVSATELASKSKGQLTKAKPSKDDSASEHADADSTNSLQGVSYEETVPAQQPLKGAPNQPNRETPSPVTNAPASNQSNAQASLKAISGPTNGVVIQDAGAWGNKPLDSPQAKDREQKKRSIWGFREKMSEVGMSLSNESNPSLVKPQPPPSNIRPVFGMPLAEAVEHCMARGTNVPLPSVVYRCLEYLEAKNAANEEGIFRLSGSNVVIRQLRERFNAEGDLDFLAEDTYYDVHAVASLLKMYLRELPSIVLTRELHLEFLQVLDLEDKARKIAAYNVLVHLLPRANWTLVRALSAFLIGIVNNAQVNKMGVRNVGIVFSPTLNIPAPVFATFLTDFNAIFETAPPSNTAVLPTVAEPRAQSPLTPEDIRSPRHQLFSDIPTPSYQDSFPRQGFAAPPPAPAEQGQHGGAGAQQHQRTRSREHQHPAGFIPLQPSYETHVSLSPAAADHKGNHNPAHVGSSVDGSSSSSSSTTKHGGPVPRTLDPGGLGATSIMRDTKARRRESSMLMMGLGGPGTRKSSLPTLKGGDGESGR